MRKLILLVLFCCSSATQAASLVLYDDALRNGFADNMDDRPVRTGNWTRCEIVGEINDDARFINFGVMSIGGGRVWVDDVSFEVIPR